MRQIMVDGEKFMLTLPTKKIWSPDFVLAAKKLKKAGIWNAEFTSLLAGAGGMDYLIGRTDLVPYTYNGPEEPTETSGWRPMLIPMDPVTDVNGAVTTGGSFYLNGHPQSSGVRALRFQGGYELTVGNTAEGKELSWVVWDGNLICTQVIAYHISHTELYDLGMRAGIVNNPTQ